MRIKIRKPVVLFFIGLALLSVLVDQQTMVTKARESFSASQAPAGWQTYKLGDDEFSVSLPTVPGMSSYRVNPELSSESILRHVIGAYAEGVAYVIYVFERKQSLDDFIAKFQYLSASSFERNLDVGGIRGKAYGFKNAERSGARFGKNLEGQMLADGPGALSASQPQPGAATNDEPPMSGRQVTLKPVVVAKPEPTYTEDARQHQVTGTIVLRCVFGSSGRVTNIAAMSRLEHGLTEKAIAAAQQIRFIPAVKDGRFVSMYMQLEYNFNLY